MKWFLLPYLTGSNGIDLEKTVFHLVGLEEKGHDIMKKKVSRKDLAPSFRTFPPAGSPWKPVDPPTSGDGNSCQWDIR